MPTPKIILFYAAETRAKRAEDGLDKIECIASAIVGNLGCEKNTVQLVEDMAHLIQRLRGELADAKITHAEKNHE